LILFRQAAKRMTTVYAFFPHFFERSLVECAVSAESNKTFFSRAESEREREVGRGLAMHNAQSRRVSQAHNKY
jgi:hypothetical protein